MDTWRCQGCAHTEEGPCEDREEAAMLESLAAASVVLATNTGERPCVHWPARLGAPWGGERAASSAFRERS